MPDVVRRTMYLGYYARDTDHKRLRRFAEHVRSAQDASLQALCADVLRSVYRYNISPLDYFLFRFWEKEHEDRETWAGTGYMYEFQLLMNPRRSRHVLIDKAAFLGHFRGLARRRFATLEDIRDNPAAAEGLLEHPSGRIVTKKADGQCGRQVAVLETDGLEPASLVSRMRTDGHDLAEEYIVQHNDLMTLSPSGLNTLRVVTQLMRDGAVHIVAARLRVSVNSHVDNMAAGNMALPLDAASGQVTGPGVFSDITRPEAPVHPVTGTPLVGFQVPHWEEALQMARAAARLTPETRSVGWDIAITQYGPELLEGNHDWCKLVWQLPVQRGLKADIDSFRRAEL